MFTDEQQRKVDEVVQTRLARSKKQSDEVIAQLESLKTSAQLTTEERDNLQKQITGMETANMTEKELAAKARKTENTKSAKILDEVTGERDMWKTRFEDSMVRREIVDAASRKDTKAFNPTQIVSNLLEHTTLVETTEDGKGTGTFVARVKFNGRDTENKAIVMDLSVPEALDEMVKMPEHSNLFESGLIDGLGANTIPGTGPLSDASYSTQEAYKKNREKIKS